MDKIVPKKWGQERILAMTHDYIMKVLEINEGRAISLQYHRYKEETWYVASGKGIATHKGESFPVGEGDYLHIPPGDIHRVRAITDLKIVEASSVHLDDIVRLEEDVH